ncbi:MAG: serpin family protein [Eubacterium sp.]|nr:serpin family protein [Eubacterium sp.]
MKYRFYGKKRGIRVFALILAMMICFAGCGKGKSSKKEDNTGNNITLQTQGNGDVITAKQGSSVKMGANLTKNDIPASTADEVEAFKKATANLAFKIMKVLSTKEPGKNIMISPDSIITALAMTANGAKGETLEEMLGILGAGMTLEEYNKALSGYNKKLASLTGVKFAAANSIWIRNTPQLQVCKDFIQSNIDYYDADIFVADFDEKTVDDINGWVNDNTQGMIDKIIDEITEDKMMYLINALSFEAQWAEQYEDGQIFEDRTFTTSDGKEQKCTMLYEKMNGLIRLNGGLGFEKSYEGGEYSFVALLPPEGMSAEEYLNSINGEDFLKALNSKDYDPDLITELPEFSYDYDTSLSETLEELGMPGAFEESADFSGMCDPNLMNLWIGDVIHKTHIELDRNGTKAAAVTAVIMCGEAMAMEEPEKIYITLDRPFVYAIVDNSTDLPVFMGIVNSIEAQ